MKTNAYEVIFTDGKIVEQFAFNANEAKVLAQARRIKNNDNHDIKECNYLAPDEHSVKQPRQGYRVFDCDVCHFSARWPTRDCHSPSGEHCPECGQWMIPIEYEPHPEWPVDQSGNLIYED